MHIGILNPIQSVEAFILGREKPNRFVKKSAAKTLLRRRLCSTIRNPKTGETLKNVIREVRIGSAPSSDSARFLVAIPTVIPKLKGPREPETLLLQYPLEDQSSYRRENRRRVWSLKTYLGPRVWDEPILSDVQR